MSVGKLPVIMEWYGQSIPYYHCLHWSYIICRTADSNTWAANLGLAFGLANLGLAFGLDAYEGNRESA